jgi:hypothetical protein
MVLEIRDFAAEIPNNRRQLKPPLFMKPTSLSRV